MKLVIQFFWPHVPEEIKDTVKSCPIWQQRHKSRSTWDWQAGCNPWRLGYVGWASCSDVQPWAKRNCRWVPDSFQRTMCFQAIHALQTCQVRNQDLGCMWFQNKLCLEMQVYTGKPQDGRPERKKKKIRGCVWSLTWPLVFRDTKSLVTIFFFTSHALGQDLLKKQLTMVGTIRRKKPELSTCSSFNKTQRSLFLSLPSVTHSVLCLIVPKKAKMCCWWAPATKRPK